MKPYLSCLIGQVGGPSEVLPLSRQGDKQWWLGSHAITICCESRSQVHREGTLTCWEPLSVFCSISSLLTLSYGASCFFFSFFFSDGQDSAVVLLLLWFGRVLVWELGELGSIQDSAINLLWTWVICSICLGFLLQEWGWIKGANSSAFRV